MLLKEQKIVLWLLFHLQKDVHFTWNYQYQKMKPKEKDSSTFMKKFMNNIKDNSKEANTNTKWSE